ncbi:MAG: efflux RND transporter periplasmic adaptor subunit [Planctomycetes bacterium]|nr:efflux RND transporter periplasmic adaptor subunit [Planctomycetota bacterium]
MRLRSLVVPAVAVAVLGAAGLVGYRTRERWVPVVFPANPTTTAEGGHAHGESGGQEHEGHDHGNRGDRVKLSPEAQQNLALDVDTLTPEVYWRTMLIPGVVVDRPGESDRSVTSKVAGVVTEVKARPGDTVRAGAPLFTLQLASEFIQAAQTDLAKTARELEFAVAKRDRTAKLVEKGTQSGAALIEEENQVKRLTTQLQAYRRQLQVFGLTPDLVTRAEKGEVVTELTITAPLRPPVDSLPVSTNSPTNEPAATLYEVQELKVNLGDQVQVGQSLCLLANHQHLFVEGRAFKSEAGALATAVEQKVPIKAEFADEAPGQWPARGPLVIHHLSNQVDTATRTFGFYLALDNQPRTFERDGRTHFVWRYRPGQRVRLKVPVEKLVTLAADGKEMLPFVLPAGAVVREGPEAFLFVQTGDVFVRKPVRVLFENRTEVVVANNGSITEADFVVRNQAAAINRALKGAAAGGEGGHGHDHAGHSHDH